MAKLTPAAEKVYAALLREVRKTGKTPSVRELRKMTGYNSTSTIQDAIELLAEEGLVRRGNVGHARTLEVVELEDDRDWIEEYLYSILPDDETETVRVPGLFLVRLARYLGVD